MLEVAVEYRIGDFTLDAAFATGTVGITTVFGASGSGKTTLVNLIAGLIAPRAGRIVAGGRVLVDTDRGIDLPPERRGIGYVFQDGRLFPHLSVAGNLGYGQRRRPRDRRAIAMDQVVRLLGLEGLLERRVAGLSGGERQRVAIGRALLTSPDLLLLDEPLAQLDLPRRRDIVPFIERLRDEMGIPIVYVTHDQDELIRLSDDVLLLDGGRGVAFGALERLMIRLDLGGLTGGLDAGAVVSVTVAAHDDSFGLSTLAFAGGELVVSRLGLAVGTPLRIRVRARDVALALEAPRDISTLNVLAGRIVELRPAAGSQTDVLLDVGVPLWARLTRKSAAELELAPDKPVHALIKSVAFDRFVGAA